MDIIGVDAGGTWVKAGRFSPDLVILDQSKVVSGASQNVDTYIDSIVEAIEQCGSSAAMIGLSIPGMFSKDRTRVHYMANVKGLGLGSGGMAIADVIGQRLGLNQVVAENDASCAALGEWAKGLGQADPNCYLLHLTWGTGIGTGYIVQGKPMYGWQGGHIPITWTELAQEPCNCGSVVDIEAHISVPHLVHQAQQWVQKNNIPTSLTPEALADTKQGPILLSKGAREGDQLAQQLLREALKWMAKGLHTMAILVYPDIITIGGAMMDHDWLLQELRSAITKTSSGFLNDSLKPEIVHRAQLGNQAGMIGAAFLARTQFLAA